VIFNSGHNMTTVRRKGARLAQAFRYLRITRWLSPVVLAAALLSAVPALPSEIADARTPEQVVSGFNDTLLQVMKDAKHLGYQGRYAALETVMNDAFDFTGMTRAAVGPSWFNMSPDQKAALVDAFRRYSIATYATQFDDYSGEQIQLTDRSEPSQGVLVGTTLTTGKGDSIRFGYLVHKVGAAWRVIDIYLDGTISQLAVRRSEFRSVLTRSGPEGLVQLLDEKAKRLAMT
jgi:phospholipid transport system substrate-binding protein